MYLCSRKVKKRNVEEMKKLILPLMVTVAVMLLSSCGSTKDVAYFQNATQVDLSASQVLFDARIMPKDELSITVSTTDPEAATPFNMTVPTTYTQNTRSTYSQAMLQSYLVDNQGNIEFPIVGTLHLGGMTKSKEKVSILEALALAGDLTIYGVRNNVQLIREDASGQKAIYMLNLNDANIINSPYYYLQQNDIVYVTPNKVKAQNSSVGSMTTLWFSATSILISLTSLLYNILK